MVAAVRSASKGKSGKMQPVGVNVGDEVLAPEYGGTEVVLHAEDYFSFRDADIPGRL